MTYVEKLIKRWRKHSFLGNMFSEKAFAKFVIEFKRAVKEQAELAGYTVVEYIEDKSSCAVILESVYGDAYVNMGNVQCLDKSWMTQIMYRKLSDRRNLSGENNHFTTLQNLAEALKALY